MYRPRATSRVINGRGRYRFNRRAAKWGDRGAVLGATGFHAGLAAGRPDIAAASALAGGASRLAGAAFAQREAMRKAEHQNRTTGRGLYTIGNDLIDGLGQGVPKFSSVNSEEGALIMSFSEYLGDVYGSDVFDNQSFRLNAGLAKTFPTLSQHALNFEEWEPMQMIAIYKPKITENLASTDGQLGTILMYTDYNGDDAPKTSKQHMIQSYGVSNGRVVDRLLHGIECDPKKLRGDCHYYVRSRSLVGVGLDRSEYDHGLLQVAVTGCPTALVNQPLGELHLMYKVKLRKPKPFTMYGLGLQQDRLRLIMNTQGTEVATYQRYNYSNIGCYVVGNPFRTDPQETNCIRFPEYFSGAVKVDCTVVHPAGLSSAPSFNQPGISGNIIRLNQVESTNVGVTETEGVNHSTTPSAQRVHYQFTIRVEQAQLGVPNLMSLANGGDGDLQGCLVHLWITRLNDYESNAREGVTTSTLGEPWY